MVVPGWVDRTVATSVIAMSDQYDNLTRRHSLTRMIDGRIVEALVTEDESVVGRWLTIVSRMPQLAWQKRQIAVVSVIRPSVTGATQTTAPSAWINTAASGRCRTSAADRTATLHHRRTE